MVTSRFESSSEKTQQKKKHRKTQLFQKTKTSGNRCALHAPRISTDASRSSTKSTFCLETQWESAPRDHVEIYFGLRQGRH